MRKIRFTQFVGAACCVAVLVLAAGPIAAAPKGPAAETEHVCISVDGVEVERSGTATCFTEVGSRSRAEARGDGADAAVHNNSTKSTATAIGVDASATVSNGDHNRAVAEGDGTGAWAFGGAHNTAIATEGAYFAGAGFLGAGPNPDSSHNRAVAIGPGSRADAAFGDHNAATAKAGGRAEALYGNHLHATAIGQDSVAGACSTDHLNVRTGAGEEVIVGCP